MERIDFHDAEIVETGDGSSTLKHSVLGELYHSRHGAWTESHHIFIKHGLSEFLGGEIKPIQVFEMGFGSGLNAALTREAADKYRHPVHYTSIELYPIRESVIRDMDMPGQTDVERERWLELHSTPWDEEVKITPYFTIHKIRGTFPNSSLKIPGKFDLIYYDAFAPAAQPELWSFDTLAECFDLLNSGGRWLSFCAKGQVRRDLQEVGFEVEALPGPPGKREITRAVKVK